MDLNSKMSELETHILYIRERLDIMYDSFKECPKGELNREKIAAHEKVLMFLITAIITMAGWMIIK